MAGSALGLNDVWSSQQDTDTADDSLKQEIQHSDMLTNLPKGHGVGREKL